MAITSHVRSNQLWYSENRRNIGTETRHFAYHQVRDTTGHMDRVLIVFFESNIGKKKESVWLALR